MIKMSAGISCLTTQSNYNDISQKFGPIIKGQHRHTPSKKIIEILFNPNA